MSKKGGKRERERESKGKKVRRESYIPIYIIHL